MLQEVYNIFSWKDLLYMHIHKYLCFFSTISDMVKASISFLLFFLSVYVFRDLVSHALILMYIIWCCTSISLSPQAYMCVNAYACYSALPLLCTHIFAINLEAEIIIKEFLLKMYVSNLG